LRKTVKVYLSLVLLLLVFTASPVLAANETPLKTGTYTAGTDVPEGLQQFSAWDPATIEIKRGTAELVSETIGKAGADAQSFFNARLKAGDEITITTSESANVQIKPLEQIELGNLPAGLYEAGIDIPEGTYSVFPSILNSVTITVVKILDQNGVRITSTHTDLDDPLEHTFTTGQLLLVTGTDIWGLTKKVQKPKTLVLSKSALDLAIRQNYKVTATVGPEDAADKAIIWKSSNTKVATVDANGNVKGIASGRAVLMATAKGNARVSKTVSVKVSPKTVKVSKTSISVTAGKKTKLTATVQPADSTNKAVKWSSSNTKIATVDSKGNVTAKAKGKAVITASAKDAKSAKIQVTVTPRVAAKSVKLNLTFATVGKGKTVQLAATVSPANTTNKNIVWSSSNKKVAVVDSMGKVKAVGKGTARITAKTANGKIGSAAITVR